MRKGRLSNYRSRLRMARLIADADLVACVQSEKTEPGRGVVAVGLVIRRGGQHQNRERALIKGMTCILSRWRDSRQTMLSGFLDKKARLVLGGGLSKG